MILGIDEVGRGPWAGPLVVGAVVLGDEVIEGLTDSKKLSAARRTVLATRIRETARGYGLGWVRADEIDEIGLAQALRLATIRAVDQITVPYHEIIIDGTSNFLADTGKGRYVTLLKKADLLIPAVSAASILAKVARDEYMEARAAEYPEYGFESHVGYGTARHRQAIETHGVTLLHRLSFAPLAKYRVAPDRDKSQESAETSKLRGDKAETIVANFLRARGHEIQARNWKTKYCEIDIVSRFEDTLYFTEVKYRKSAQHGSGLEAITGKKLNQMTFAAKIYLSREKHTDNARLAVASVSGDTYTLDIWQPID